MTYVLGLKAWVNILSLPGSTSAITKLLTFGGDQLSNLVFYKEKRLVILASETLLCEKNSKNTILP